MMINQAEMATALAKATAYKRAGKDELAASWGWQLVQLLSAASIIDPAAILASTRVAIKEN